MPESAASTADTGVGTARSRSPVRCRSFGPADFDGVVALLRIGFPERSEVYWRQGFERLEKRSLPAGVPRFGYVLEHGAELVGVLITIHSMVEEGGGRRRCNLSSWYVDPRFRGYGVILDSFAMSDRTVTYLNASPAPHTVPMHEARGFRRHGLGLFLALPALSRRRAGQSIRLFDGDADQGLNDLELALAREHRAYGCLCLVCTDEAGARIAIFVSRRLPMLPDRVPVLTLPCFQMIYGPFGQDFANWAGAIGRYFLRRLTLLVLLDVAGPLAGVRGRHFPDRKPRCVRGPHPPAIGDLTATEVAVFGP